MTTRCHTIITPVYPSYDHVTWPLLQYLNPFKLVPRSHDKHCKIGQDPFIRKTKHNMILCHKEHHEIRRGRKKSYDDMMRELS